MSKDNQQEKKRKRRG